MLELDSPKWEKLSHAYGNASDIPEKLRAIRKLPYCSDEDGPWMELYSSLCHQFSVDTASYAAFPHLIKFAQESKGKLRMDLLDLASTIEAERNMQWQPAFPRGLKKPYLEALSLAPDLAIELLSHKWDDQKMRELLGMIAIFRGHSKLGFSLVASSDEIECKECGHIQKPPYYEEFED